MNKEEIKCILDSFWYGRIGRDEAIDKLLNLHIVMVSDEKLQEEYNRGLKDGGTQAVMELLDSL